MNSNDVSNSSISKLFLVDTTLTSHMSQVDQYQYGDIQASLIKNTRRQPRREGTCHVPAACSMFVQFMGVLCYQEDKGVSRKII